ncbi:MAG: hypothetical protein NUW02_02945 [Candidatus Campbellbacteria bacterium]|nr:hypothetical protein [Candidatus Campbellbacteria bacterium]
MKSLLTLIFLLSPLLASATVVTIESTGSVFVGGTQLISVSLDTEGEQINTIEGDVALPQEFLTINSVQDANSVISFWTETPSIKEGIVHFSGIIPGGFIGKGIIAQIEVTGVREGVASLRVPTFTVFLHDGEGTAQKARVQENTIDIVTRIGNEPITVTVPDTTPPESFSIVLVEDDASFEGKRVVIFATHDEQSGMSYYEVQETENDTPSELLWTLAQSPFVLSDTKTKYIFVRAYDNAGNSTIVRYDGDLRSPLERSLYTLVFLALVLLLIVVFIRRKHHRYARLSRTKRFENN